MADPSTAKLHLTGEQVREIVERSGLGRQELAAQLGCGTSQLHKYEEEGLPPRMNRDVMAGLIQLGMELGVLSGNATLRNFVGKLSKGRRS